MNVTSHGNTMCVYFLPYGLLLRQVAWTYYSCSLSTATIEYTSPSVCLSVCVYDNSKNNVSLDLKLEHLIVYENSSDEFDIGHCPIKVKVTA